MAQPLTIIGSFVSPYVRKVLACLNLKGLDYEVDPITPFFGNDEFERLSPLRRIPVLIDGDFSSAIPSVICAYLDEAYPGHPLLPADPKDRARARWLEEYADTRLGDLFIWGLFYQKVVHPLVWGEPGDQARIAQGARRGHPGRARLSRRRAARPTASCSATSALADIADRQLLPQRRLCRVRDRRRIAGRAPPPSSSATLAHPCIADLLPFEDVQRSAEIKGRRQALLDAGAPLTERDAGAARAAQGNDAALVTLVLVARDPMLEPRPQRPLRRDEARLGRHGSSSCGS